MARFRDKVALVTGGSSGIGRVVALRLASEGAQVAVVASSDPARSRAVAAEIEAAGGTATSLVADVSDADQVEQCARATVEVFGRIDVLVNAAGVYYPTPLGATKPADVQTMLDINLKGTFLMMNAVVPGMIAQSGGRIVNFSSVAAFMGSLEHSLYCAVKSGVMMMTRAAALELAPHGIHVNAVAPGNTATPMNEHIRTDDSQADRRAAIAARTPSKRKFSDPEDIANIVAFLASDESIAMHGSTILADEGRSAG